MLSTLIFEAKCVTITILMIPRCCRAPFSGDSKGVELNLCLGIVQATSLILVLDLYANCLLYLMCAWVVVMLDEDFAPIQLALFPRFSECN